MEHSEVEVYSPFGFYRNPPVAELTIVFVILWVTGGHSVDGWLAQPRAETPSAGRGLSC